ncbi:MAG: hypothetical protein KAS72_03010 [Phycisphaerales bacterium]|nr:hypothetical protein [Phycisphaerales bacterium]
MSWIWPSFVDRELPLTREQRRAIDRDAWKMWFRNRWNFILYMLVPISYVLALPLLRDAAGMLAGTLGADGLGQRMVRAGVVILLPAACFVLAGAVLQRWRFAPCVYEATRRHGCDVCTRCGYWLRGLDDDAQRCPECGARREPMPVLPLEGDG